jgi:phosphoglycerate dehydrogenase-like enzyme
MCWAREPEEVHRPTCPQIGRSVLAIEVLPMSRLTVSLVANDLPPTPDGVGPRLSERGIELRERTCANPAEVVETAGDADVVRAMGGSPVFAAEVPFHLHRCRVILRTGTGTGNIPVDAATHRGILVANTPEATRDQVVEHARFWRASVRRHRSQLIRPRWLRSIRPKRAAVHEAESPATTSSGR